MNDSKQDINRLKVVLVEKTNSQMACGTVAQRSNNRFKMVY